MNSPAELKDLFEGHLAEVREQASWKGKLYAPMSYILNLGGKRVRPLVLLLAYQSLGGKVSKALNAAAAVELFHNFTLMHDDIMDRAPMRRGQATVHQKWDENVAILAGDTMFAIATQYLMKDFPECAGPLVTEFMRISVGVCEGQMADMELAGKESASIGEYIEMIRKKTAMLIGGSMSLGAIAAGADMDAVKAMYAYGEAAGIGFQLQDDYLDVYAASPKFGKQLAGDILENKMTFLLIRALEKANSQQSKALEQLLHAEQDDQRKIAGVKAIYEELGIRAETREQISAYFEQASIRGAHLKAYPGFAQIDQFFQALMQRDY
ncbi:MAG TPA: polyprenyl synthetase family protein [Bacteroidetes bacterium]|nr:polyprenyl synthetase family protein [Bacteroidota bacterium]